MGYYGWEEQCEVEYECPKCQAHEATIGNLNDDIEIAGKMVTSIITKLYSSEKIDFAKLESELDELCYHLDIPIAKGDLQIQQKRLPTFLSNIIELNKIA